MQSGLLTEAFNRERVAKFAPDAWRRRSPEFQEPNLSRNLALRCALRQIAQRHCLALLLLQQLPGVVIKVFNYN